jgi:hypothetical protein
MLWVRTPVHLRFNRAKNYKFGGGRRHCFGNNISIITKPDKMITATNAKKKKYVMGETELRLRCDKVSRISQIIPIENRIAKICANTIQNGGQYISGI